VRKLPGHAERPLEERNIANCQQKLHSIAFDDFDCSFDIFFDGCVLAGEGLDGDCWLGNNFLPAFTGVEDFED
jgi:hypothetical protein